MIEPKYFTLDKLFRDRVFQIPHYQRFYSWRDKQLEDLFDDLKRLDRKRDSTHHFMATIVCHRTGEIRSVKTEQYSLYEVVDGQQRITTLALLFKALERRLTDQETKQGLARLLVKDDKNLLLLQANNANQHLFNRYLREGIAPDELELRHSSDRRLAGAIIKIEQFLSDWEAKHGDLLGLTGLLKNRIGFVVYDTEDRWAVHSIFESLNSRGLAVDWLDKAKSVLMGIAFEKSELTAANALIAELHNFWSQIYLQVASVPKDSDDILRIAATLYASNVSSKALSAEDSVSNLRDFCDTADKTIVVSRWINDVASKMVILRENVTLVPLNKYFQARVLAIAIMLAENLTIAERAQALLQLERVTFRIYGLFDKDAKTRASEFLKVAVGIINGNEGFVSFIDIMHKLKLLGKDFPIDLAVTEYFKSNNYDGFEVECRYLLWRYEEYLALKQRAQINQALREQIWAEKSASQTIEHILPQSHERVTGWRGMFEGTKGKKCVDKLANLILLPSGLNSEAGRKLFSDKVSIYKRADGLRSIKEITSLHVWDVKAFEHRQRKLKEFVTETFSDLA